MKKFLSILLLFSGILFASSLTTSQARLHIGENATVCGKAVSGYYAKRTYGKPTFINLDKPYPNQPFTIVIWDENREKFNNPERAYNGRTVCVSGYIDSYRGIPQIVVEEPSQIEVR